MAGRESAEFSQIGLCVAIYDYLGRCGLALNARQSNAVAKAADIVYDEVRMPHRPVAPDGGVERWLQSDETGLSSRYLLWALTGQECRGKYRNGVWSPADPGDFGRCVGLLDAAPHLRQQLPKLSAPEHGKEWNALVPVWGELESLYREELPSGKAPKLYARMREVFDGGA